MTLKDLIEIIDKRPSWTNAALKSAILDQIAKDIEIRTEKPSGGTFKRE